MGTISSYGSYPYLYGYGGGSLSSTPDYSAIIANLNSALFFSRYPAYGAQNSGNAYQQGGLNSSQSSFGNANNSSTSPLSATQALALLTASLGGSSASSNATAGVTATPASYLRNGYGTQIAIQAATDGAGNTVTTANLTDGSGKLVGFQTAPPSGFKLTSAPPVGAQAVSAPLLTDSQGNPVSTSVLYTSSGSAVLQIALSDRLGNSVNFYSQVDSAGNALDPGTASTGNQFVDNNANPVPVAFQNDLAGNSLKVATLQGPTGSSALFYSQSPAANDLASSLSSVNPVGAQISLPPPINPYGGTVAATTLFNASGGAVQRLTLTANGSSTVFYSAFDSNGIATQPGAIDLSAAPATPTSPQSGLGAFSINPGLVASSAPAAPPGTQPFLNSSGTSAGTGSLGALASFANINLLLFPASTYAYSG